MNARTANTRSLMWSLLLHAGLMSGLALMALPCTSFEHFFDDIGLPAWLSPVECTKPVVMPGPVIEATLVGPAAAPKRKPSKHQPPPKQSKPKTTSTPEPPKVKTLPPPPEKPALKDQQKVVAMAEQKAEQAAQEQQQRERQRQSELEADKLLAQLDKLKSQTAEADRKSRLEKQRLEQLADLKNKPAAPQNVPEATEARTGAGGAENSLAAQYAGALTSTITQNWLRPDNIPAGVVCPIHIEQIPGGQVISVRVLPTCPFDEPGRRSVKNAVLRAQPLPYKGYQQVFQRDITLNFKVTE